MPNPIDQSAQAIADALAPSANAPSARWRWGTVKSVGSNGTMNVEIGGATVPGVRCAQHVMGANVGDRVRVLYCGTEAIVDAVRASAKLMSLPTISSAILLKDERLDRDGTAPASNTYSRIVGIQDKDGENVAYIQAAQYTDGRTGCIINAYNEKSDGTAVGNTINVMVAKDGTRSYSVTAPAAFRDAIGLSVENRTLTANTSNVTMQGESYARSFGKVVQLNLVFTTNKQIPTWDNQNFLVGTMDRACAYSKQYMTAIAQIGGQWTLMQAGVNSSGEVRLRTVGTAIPNGTWTWVFGTYISA